MSRDQDTLLRSILSLDISEARLGNHYEQFASAKKDVEILLEPHHSAPIEVLTRHDIFDILHHLNAQQVGALKYFLWLNVPYATITRLRYEESYRQTLQSLGIQRVWPNLPLFPQVGQPPVSHPDFNAVLQTIGFSHPTVQDGTGVRWAIIDTDVKDTHIHFQNMLKPIERMVVSSQGVHPATSPFNNISGHGTHITGIFHTIAPGADITSIALEVRRVDPNNPKSPVFAKSTAHLEKALEWVSQQSKIDGVNISMGIAARVQDPLAGKGPGCRALNDCVAAGKLVVVAAGNYGERDGEFREISITDPANAHSALVVGACETEKPEVNGIWSYSSHGPTPDGRVKPDLVAPGVDIESCSFVDNTSFKRESGTSQATAIASGVCAVLLARATYPLSPARLTEILKSTAQDLQRLTTYQGAGVIRLDNVLSRLQQEEKSQWQR